MSLRPLGERVVVRRVRQVEVHESGLIIPASARELPQLGQVLAVGPGKPRGDYRSSVELAPGDYVIFEKFVGGKYAALVDGEELLVLPFDSLYVGVYGLEL